MDIVNFERDMNTLRGFVKSSKLETDVYKIIILIERYVLEYGTEITKKTVSVLKSKQTGKEEKNKIIEDLLQDKKPINNLVIFKYL